MAKDRYHTTVHPVGDLANLKEFFAEDRPIEGGLTACVYIDPETGAWTAPPTPVAEPDSDA